MRFLLPILAVFCLAPSAAAAPREVSRILRSFDFEERDKGNAESLPMYWTKVTGADYAHYVNGQLATDKARSGRYSFRYDLNGGSLVYRYDTGRIKVQAGAHYRVEGYVQSAPGFRNQPLILNGASQLLTQAFGETGAHTRIAVGVSELPLNAAVELALWVEVKD